ncbi:MAG: carboxypeptidase-like regulatory domain-containing protein [Gemmatimonadales bacterium]
MSVLAGLLSVTLLGTLAAQDRAGVIAGVVTDGTNRLAQASVEIFGRKGVITTGTDGAFRFDSLPKGVFWLRVRRIGYAPVTFASNLARGEHKDYQVELEAMAYELPELLVQGGMTRQRYTEFRWRQRSGWGKFFARDDIDRVKPFDLIALVQQGLPFVSRWRLEQPNWFTPEPITAGYFPAAGYRSRLSNRSDCYPSVSVNGSAPWPGNSLSDYGLEDVEAVEVYRGMHVPIEFQGYRMTGCGLVVLWLR